MGAPTSLGPAPLGSGALQELREAVSQGVSWGAHSGSFVTVGRGSREAAVLLLFGRVEDGLTPAGPQDLDLLLLQRAHTLGDHPGQVAFPGGRVDWADGGPVEAALREAQEETGLNPGGVEVLGSLASLPLPVSDHQVTPVVGWWQQESPVYPVDERESARVFRVPVADLVNPENRRTATMPRHGRMHAGPAFLVGGTTVWGFTAIILADLLGALRWDQPWDRERLVNVYADR